MLSQTEHGVAKEFNEHEVHAVNNERESRHDGTSEDGTKTNHQKPTACARESLQELPFLFEAEQEVREDAQQCDEVDHVVDRLGSIDFAADHAIDLPDCGLDYIGRHRGLCCKCVDLVGRDRGVRRKLGHNLRRQVCGLDDLIEIVLWKLDAVRHDQG